MPIHGPQRFASDDIGDFVVARADGSACVLPRQRGRRCTDAGQPGAARRRPPGQYASPAAAARGARTAGAGLRPPASAARTVGGTAVEARRALRGCASSASRGTCPPRSATICCGLVTPAGQTGGWRRRRCRSTSACRASATPPAHFDEAQLRHWQGEAVRACDDRRARSRGWASAWHRLAASARRERFVTAVRGNLLLPQRCRRRSLTMVSPGELAHGEPSRCDARRGGARVLRAAMAAWRRTCRGLRRVDPRDRGRVGPPRRGSSTGRCAWRSQAALTGPSSRRSSTSWAMSVVAARLRTAAGPRCDQLNAEECRGTTHAAPPQLPDWPQGAVPAHTSRAGRGCTCAA